MPVNAMANATNATVNAATDPAANATAEVVSHSGLTFCREYVELAGDLAGLAKIFLIAALVLGIAYGFVEVLKRYQETPAVRAGVAPNTTAIKEIAEAIKGLVEALAKAPVWLALFGVGLMIFWVAGSAIPAMCEKAANELYESTSQQVDEHSNNVSANSGNNSNVTSPTNATAVEGNSAQTGLSNTSGH